MIRPALRRIAACLVTGLVLSTATPLATSPAVAAPGAPLSVSIGSLTPSVIPGRGMVTVTGQVTNDSDQTWRNLNVYLLTSDTPFSTQDELAKAARTEPQVEFGRRLTDPGLFEPVGDLAPGSTVGYTLQVPRRELLVSGEPGVYWLGVHVLGASDEGRDAVADGRARTFVPLMERGAPETALSLVLPIRGRVQRDSQGALANLDTWQDLISPDGRLRRVMDLAGTSLDIPLTLVVDPAVLDAVASVARGNQGMSIAPTDGEPDAPDETPTPSESADASPDASPSADPGAEEGTDGADGEPAPSPQAAQAARWLGIFGRQAGQHTVLSVAYAEADLAAMVRHGFGRLHRGARELSTQTMETFGVESTPVVAPLRGFLPSSALEEVDRRTPVILSDRAAPEASSPVIGTRGGPQILLTDSTAGQGGPRPGPPYSALAMRQRIVSEAALHALSDDRAQPLVVSLPDRWDPGPDWRIADFFDGLDVDWLSTLDVPSATASTTALAPQETAYDERLRYPRGQRRAEIPPRNLEATGTLVEHGDLLAGLLAQNDTVDAFLAKAALQASSAWARNRPRPARSRVQATVGTVQSLLGQVEIDAPAFVTMSSEEGPLGVTLVNGLPEPVVVGIIADTGSEDLEIASPEPVTIGADERASVRLRTTSREIGVHSVTLTPTTADGERIGTGTRFNVRSSQVGFVIWLIIGVGAGVLVIASGIRIARRVRERKATHGPLLGAEGE